MSFLKKKNEWLWNSVNVHLSMDAIYSFIEMRSQNCLLPPQIHAWDSFYENLLGLRSNHKKFNHLFFCRRAKLFQSELLKPWTLFFSPLELFESFYLNLRCLFRPWTCIKWNMAIQKTFCVYPVGQAKGWCRRVGPFAVSGHYALSTVWYWPYGDNGDDKGPWVSPGKPENVSFKRFSFRRGAYS